VRVAHVNLTTSVLLVVVAGAVMVVARLKQLSETIPEWLVFGTFTFFIVACVLHWRATSKRDEVLREAEYLRRSAIRAGLVGDRTSEQTYYSQLAALTGDGER
jgi:hypothetical protein